jgi:hypothetical protein
MFSEAALQEAKNELRILADSPLFDTLFNNIKTEIAFKMVNTADEKERNALYIKAQLVEELRGEIVRVANDVRAKKHGR